jgi:hypothetical protein
MHFRSLLALGGILASAPAVPALDEPFCAVPENCVDDFLGMRFPAGGSAEITGIAVGEEIALEVFLDVKTAHFQAFHLFLKGPVLPPPFLSCRSDPSPDTLTCNQPNCR